MTQEQIWPCRTVGLFVGVTKIPNMFTSGQLAFCVGRGMNLGQYSGAACSFSTVWRRFATVIIHHPQRPVKTVMLQGLKYAETK